MRKPAYRQYLYRACPSAASLLKSQIAVYFLYAWAVLSFPSSRAVFWSAMSRKFRFLRRSFDTVAAINPAARTAGVASWRFLCAVLRC